jgi:hypothetical protein
MARTVRLLAAAVLAAAVIAVPATLAGAPGAAGAVAVNVWQVTAVYPENSGVDAIVAASPVNAWAAESCSGTCRTGSDGLTLRHWNGAQWAVAGDPAAFSHLGGATPVLAMNPGPSATLWALSGSVAVRWTGTGWAAPVQLTRNFEVTSAVAVTASDVWAMGQLSTGQLYTERYNGKTWSPAPVPPIGPGDISATSPSDVWAIGPAEGGVPNSLTYPMVASHWNGSTWTTTKLPSVALDDGSYTQSVSIVADGPHNAWAFSQVADEVIPGNESGIELYHWNGSTWSAVTVPYLVDAQPAPSGVFSDGFGGIWFWATSASGANYMVRDSAAGRWSERPLAVPQGASQALVNDVAPVPGSALLWAAGTAAFPGGGTEGLILRYPG